MSFMDFILNVASVIPGVFALKGIKILPILKRSNILSRLVYYAGKRNKFNLKLNQVFNFFANSFEFLSNPNNFVTILSKVIYDNIPEGFKIKGINALISFLSNKIRDVGYILNPKNWQSIFKLFNSESYQPNHKVSKKINFNLFKVIFEYCKKFGKPLIDAIVKGDNAVVRAIKKGGNAVVRAIKKGGNAVVRAIKKGGNAVVRAIKKGGNVVVRAIKKSYTSIKYSKTMKKIKSHIKYFKPIIKPIVNGINFVKNIFR